MGAAPGSPFPSARRGGDPLAKLRVLSTHLFMNQRLHPGLLELAGQSGAQAVEIFAARQHFDYTSREQVAELAAWFRSNPLEAWSMHAPLYPDREMGRSGAPAFNLLHPEKARRIAAMDEIKRALETAEHIPFRNLVVHLGERDDEWSPRAIEYALTALEHLGAFARPLGVRPLVENLTGEPTTPEHLMEILEIGHLDSIGVCLDLGHAHMTVGVPEAIATLGAPHRSGPRARQPRPQGRASLARRRRDRLACHGRGSQRAACAACHRPRTQLQARLRAAGLARAHPPGIRTAGLNGFRPSVCQIRFALFLRHPHKIRINRCGFCADWEINIAVVFARLNQP